jgi:hypothetical protein
MVSNVSPVAAKPPGMKGRMPGEKISARKGEKKFFPGKEFCKFSQSKKGNNVFIIERGIRLIE